MKRQGYGSLRCFKTKDSRHSKFTDTCIIYIITSFINSETTALLDLTSFTEDVTNIPVETGRKLNVHKTFCVYGDRLSYANSFYMKFRQKFSTLICRAVHRAYSGSCQTSRYKSFGRNS